MLGESSAGAAVLVDTDDRVDDFDDPPDGRASIGIPQRNKCKSIQKQQHHQLPNIDGWR